MIKARKQFILDPAKIKRVQRILKTATETEAVNLALDQVVANEEIALIHEKIAGKCRLQDMDQSGFRG